MMNKTYIESECKKQLFFFHFCIFQIIMIDIIIDETTLSYAQKPTSLLLNCFAITFSYLFYIHFFAVLIVIRQKIEILLFNDISCLFIWCEWIILLGKIIGINIFISIIMILKSLILEK